jgi:metal-responsive CopG/Arc/MetJ family transcriptional regulator
MAALDAEIRKGIQSRDDRRRQIVREILQRMAAREKKKYAEEHLTATVDVISMLSGFATYDVLATAGHSEKEIIAIITRLVHFAASEPSA